MPLADAVGLSNMPAVRPSVGKDGHHEQAGSSTGPTSANEGLDEKQVSTPFHPPTSRTLNWEEMVELLKQVPCFTEVEPLMTKMSDFFSLTKQITVEIDGNPPISTVVQLSFGTLKSIVSCIQTM